MSVPASVLYEREYEEEIARPLSPHSIEKLGQAIDHTFKFNMHLFHAILKSGVSFAISPLSLMSSLVSMVVSFDEEASNRLAKSIFDIEELTEEEEYLMMLQTKYHLSVALEEKEHYFRTASYLFLRDEYRVKEVYKNAFKDYTGMEVRSLQEGASVCNEIKTCVGEGFDDIDFSDIDENSILLIVNRSSFVPLWKNAFEKTTMKIEFVNADSTISKHHYLRAKGSFQMGFSDYFQARVITLPLKWEHMSMTIFLPDNDKNFTSTFETSDDCICDELANAINSLRLPAIDTEVWIPEFKVQTKISMKQFLAGLDSNELFDIDGNCSGILEEPTAYELIVDDLIQICNFEAKANCCTQTRNDIDNDGLPIFKCNRPFIFAVTADINGNNIIIYQAAVNELCEL